MLRDPSGAKRANPSGIADGRLRRTRRTAAVRASGHSGGAKEKPMTWTDELYQRDRSFHPPAFTPEYKTSVLRSPRNSLLSLQNSVSELTGPRFGHSDIGPLDNDLIKNYAKTGDPISERIVVHWRVLDENGKPVPDTLVEFWQANAGRALSAQEGHLSGADRSEFRRMRTRADVAGRLLLFPHRQARSLSLAQLCQQLAAGPHPFLDLRHSFRPAADHPDVFRGRSAHPHLPDRQHHCRQGGALPADRAPWT